VQILIRGGRRGSDCVTVGDGRGEEEAAVGGAELALADSFVGFIHLC